MLTTERAREELFREQAQVYAQTKHELNAMAHDLSTLHMRVQAVHRRLERLMVALERLSGYRRDLP